MPVADGAAHCAGRERPGCPARFRGAAFPSALPSPLPMPLEIRTGRAALLACAALTFSLPLRAQEASTTGAGTATPRTSADSTFTGEQADRGAKVFSRVCLECHERLEMANDDFRLKWEGQTTFDLFQSIATTMPDSDPGSLPRADYLDVVAYILKLNGVPTGPAELAEDSTVMSMAKLHLPTGADGDAAGRYGAQGHDRSPCRLRGCRHSARRHHGRRYDRGRYRARIARWLRRTHCRAGACLAPASHPGAARSLSPPLGAASHALTAPDAPRGAGLAGTSARGTWHLLIVCPSRKSAASDPVLGVSRPIFVVRRLQRAAKRATPARERCSVYPSLSTTCTCASSSSRASRAAPPSRQTAECAAPGRWPYRPPSAPCARPR